MIKKRIEMLSRRYSIFESIPVTRTHADKYFKEISKYLGSDGSYRVEKKNVVSFDTEDHGKVYLSFDSRDKTDVLYLDHIKFGDGKWEAIDSNLTSIKQIPQLFKKIDKFFGTARNTKKEMTVKEVEKLAEKLFLTIGGFNGGLHVENNWKEGANYIAEIIFDSYDENRDIDEFYDELKDELRLIVNEIRGKLKSGRYPEIASIRYTTGTLTVELVMNCKIVDKAVNESKFHSFSKKRINESEDLYWKAYEQVKKILRDSGYDDYTKIKDFEDRIEVYLNARIHGNDSYAGNMISKWFMKNASKYPLIDDIDYDGNEITFFLSPAVDQ